MDAEDSIKFLVARSTDTFLDVSKRQHFLEKLLSKIKREYDAPQAAFQLLSHKLLSPDQMETLQTLQVLDQLVRQAGNRVAVEVGKFKFLNNFIRLLSPKYQGLTTSQPVRRKAIELLYLWKESLRQLKKVEEVYQLLKKQNIIEQDPELVQPIPTIKLTPKSQPKLAAFEDEQKAQLLAELLRSSKSEDLQAANRMIKSMVRAEDQKVERYHKRKEVLESAAATAEALWSLLEEGADDSQGHFNGNGPQGGSGEKYCSMKNFFDSLQAFRPTLFRFASEAAESNNEQSSEEQAQWILADILALNDQINKTLQVFQDRTCSKQNNALQPSPNSSKDLISICEWENTLEDVNMLCSLSAANSPSIARKATPKRSDILQLAEGNLCKNCAQNNQVKNIIEELKDLDLMQPQPAEMVSQAIDYKQHTNGDFLLDDVSVSTNQLEISGSIH